MRLRRVTVSGFKTFARRGDVELEPGITAVVGPNGSGKSNLVDAIRWALGETNARELRGARMEEVIYAGGEGRAPMGMAQVEIVIDNEEGRLPLDDAEVSIARRVTRGGDSEYRLNGGRVRLRDVERLLGGTGLTQNGYGVVAQNDIDGIIEASPLQRRALVEEAAGVRGLRAAREDCTTRVSGVETRLLRLADVLAETEPRLSELEEQATVALEHNRLATRLAELRGSLAREEWRAARALARRARQRLSTALSRAEAAVEAEAAFAARLEVERERLSAARQAQRAATSALESARLAAERAAGDLRRFAEQAVAAGLQRAGACVESAAADADVDVYRRQLAELGDRGATAAATLETMEERLAVLRGAHQEAAHAAERAAQRLAGAEERRAAAERDRAAAATAVRDDTARAELLEETAATISAEIAAARERAAGLAAEAEAARQRSVTGEARLETLRESADEARGMVERARQRLSDARSEEAASHAASRAAAARVAGIRGQMDGALGGGAVAGAVARGELRAGRLIELIRVLDPADGPAIEAAMEHHLGAWLVDDLEAAARILRGSAGREEIVAAGLDEPPPTPPPAGVRAALDAVSVDAAARGAVACRLARVWLAGDLGTARSAVTAAGGVAILPDGTRVDAAGLRGGGRPGATVALAEAERAAAAVATTAEETETAAAQRAVTAAAALTAADDELATRSALVESARVVAAEAAALAAAALAGTQTEETRAIALEAERAGRQDAARAARAGAAGATSELARKEAELSACVEAAEAERLALEASHDAVSAAADAARAGEIDAARAEPEARDIQRRLGAARQALAAAEQRARVAGLRLTAAEELALAAIARGGDSSRRLGVATGEVESAGVTAEQAAAPVVQAEAMVSALEIERSEVAVAAARAADERTSAEAEVAATEERVAELADRVRGDQLDEGPEPDADAAERAEREIVRLERRVAALGPVNALAPQQYASLVERVHTLRRDHDDLATACVDLRLLAGHLGEEIETRFDAVFGAVAYHFRMLFEELFPGGRATLRLTRPPVQDEDVDETGAAEAAPAGVEILAQPPGKRLQSLSLLSGGERALTALAVILALQHVNPSPFYVFDEVDAPLDDANIGRFTRLLRRLAAAQQFLVVTHNHATMAAADALYGVTMEREGTSRLLSVRLVDGEPVPQRQEAVLAAL